MSAEPQTLPTTGLTANDRAILGSLLPRMRRVFERYTSSPLPQWGLFTRTLRVSRYRKNDAVDQSSHEVLLVISGLLKEVYDEPSIQGQVADFFAEGSVLATRLEPPWARALTTPFSVISNDSSRSKIPLMTAVAIEPSVVLRVNADVVHELSAKHPQWGEAQASFLWTYIEAQHAGILNLRENNTWARYQALMARSNLAGRLTQRDIAAYLGITESALSRLLRRTAEAARH